MTTSEQNKALIAVNTLQHNLREAQSCVIHGRADLAIPYVRDARSALRFLKAQGLDAIEELIYAIETEPSNLDL